MSGEYEKVHHPKHYNSHPSGVECIKIIRWFPHNIGAAIKYLWRVGLKPGENAVTELEKARFYIDDEIERLRLVQHREMEDAKRSLHDQASVGPSGTQTGLLRTTT